MRDSKGRFLPGHKQLSSRDKTTGRFISKKVMENIKDRYQQVKREVDEFLKDYNGAV